MNALHDAAVVGLSLLFVACNKPATAPRPEPPASARTATPLDVAPVKPDPAVDSAQPEALVTAPAAEVFADPLPDGVRARLGTDRLRAAAPVSQLVFSPDGGRLAAVDADQVITIWDALSGARIATHRSDSRVDAVAFWPDRPSLCVLADELRDFDIPSASLGPPWTAGELGRPVAFVIDPTGARLFVAAGITVQAMHAHRRDILWHAQLAGDALSLDGELVVRGPGSITRLDAATGAIRGTSPIGEPEAIASPAMKPPDLAVFRDANRVHVTAFALAPDGRRGAWATGAGDLHIADDTGRRLDASFVRCDALELSPDGQTVACVGPDLAALLEASTGRLVRSLALPRATLGPLAWRPDSRRLVLASADPDLLHVIDAATGREIRAIVSRFVPDLGLAWSGDGASLTVVDDVAARRIDAESGLEQHLTALPAGTALARPMVGGAAVLVLGQDGHASSVPLATAAEMRALEGTTAGMPVGVALSGDGKLAYSLSTEGAVVRWDLAAGRALVATDVPFADTLIGIATDLRGDRVAITTDVGVVLLDGPTLAAISALPAVRAFGVASDGATLFAGAGAPLALDLTRWASWQPADGDGRVTVGAFLVSPWYEALFVEGPKASYRIEENGERGARLTCGVVAVHTVGHRLQSRVECAGGHEDASPPPVAGTWVASAGGLWRFSEAESADEELSLRSGERLAEPEPTVSSATVYRDEGQRTTLAGFDVAGKRYCVDVSISGPDSLATSLCFEQKKLPALFRSVMNGSVTSLERR